MSGILNIQISSTIGQKQTNYNKISHFIKNNSDKKLDLVVMPEYFSTGISYEQFPNEFVDETGGDTITFIQTLAKKYNTNIIAGSVIEKSDENLYNTTFAIDRTGKTLAKYRKIHLQNNMGGQEGDLITAGQNEVVVDFDFGKVGLATSFDIRYPLQFKKLTQMGAQLIVLPSAWVVPAEIYEDQQALNYAQQMWIAMNRIRAYDNGVYLITSNQTGYQTPHYGAVGNSLIISPTAQIIANAKDKQNAIYADIDLELTKYLKSVYPIAWID